MSTPPRVLIVLYSAIGDVVMASFAVSGLRTLHPDAEIGWMVDERCQDVIDPDKLVNHLFVTKRASLKKSGRRTAAVLDPFRQAIRSRRMRPEVAFALQGHIKNLLAARLSGAKEIFVMPSRDGLVRALSRPIPEFQPEFPQRERYISLVRQRFQIPSVERPIMPTVTSPIPPSNRPRVLLSVATNSPTRDYPTERWAWIAEALINAGNEVGVIGVAGSPAPKVDGLQNWVGQHSLRETMGLISSAQLHIGGDTGTGHIAAAYGVPTVVLFGPTNENQYRPAGAPSVTLKSGTEPSAIEVEAVLDAANQLLRATSYP
ncbi:MAG: glycosyltransferase family 9 protein [Fimbriimonadaceae bacterium]|nr:glycosyltransferase family 9 protein [Fimbriimonadaceae bacterium]